MGQAVEGSRGTAAVCGRAVAIPRLRNTAARLALAVAASVGQLACGATGLTDPTAAGTAASAMSYVLVAPLKSNNTYLMDLDGQLVHEWHGSAIPGLSAYLLPNGHLLRASSLGLGAFPAAGGNGGRIEEYDWDGNVVWTFDYISPTYQQHHDMQKMPNGHVLMVAWEMRSGAEAIAAGRDPTSIPANGQVWPDTVVEVDPATNGIVWSWRLWDHLLPPGAAPSDHPELVDSNANAVASSSDWTHVNAIDYNASLDQVMLSSRNMSEIWVIDHSTTTEEAAGHAGGASGRGGDLLFRWGKPANFGVSGPQQLFGQHNAHWIEDGLSGAGQILVLDNGDANLRPYTTAVQLAPIYGARGQYAIDPAAGFFDPIAPIWQYQANPPESLFAPIISSVQRLANGDTLVCDGTKGHILEVTPAGDTTWSYLLTDTAGNNGVLVFRATRYEGSYPGLAGRTLTPQGPLRIELNP
jgi:hypothetical protein